MLRVRSTHGARAVPYDAMAPPLNFRLRLQREPILGLHKICLANLSKMGSEKKEAILQAKWAVNFVKKSKMGKE